MLPYPAGSLPIGAPFDNGRGKIRVQVITVRSRGPTSLPSKGLPATQWADQCMSDELT